MRAAVCYNKGKAKSMALLPEVLERLSRCGVEVAAQNLVPPECDIVITVGGDGTILSWGKAAAEMGKPLLGINTGRLGFMATLEHGELHRLEQLRSRAYRISCRMMMRVTIGDRSMNALNDVVLTKATYAKLPDFRVSSRDIEVVKIRADGVIFSTATGSTAYALSAGGPIIEPELACVEFTPLCAHSLFGRPMIFTADSELQIWYDGYEGSDVFMSVDGDEGIPVAENEKIILQKSPTALQLIDFEGNSFYGAVHGKLMRPLK